MAAAGTDRNRGAPTRLDGPGGLGDFPRCHSLGAVGGESGADGGGCLRRPSGGTSDRCMDRTRHRSGPRLVGGSCLGLRLRFPALADRNGGDHGRIRPAALHPSAAGQETSRSHHRRPSRGNSSSPRPRQRRSIVFSCHQPGRGPAGGSRHTVGIDRGGGRTWTSAGGGPGSFPARSLGRPGRRLVSAARHRSGRSDRSVDSGDHPVAPCQTGDASSHVSSSGGGDCAPRTERTCRGFYRCRPGRRSVADLRRWGGRTRRRRARSAPALAGAL